MENASPVWNPFILIKIFLQKKKKKKIIIIIIIIIISKTLTFTTRPSVKPFLW